MLSSSCHLECRTLIVIIYHAIQSSQLSILNNLIATCDYCQQCRAANDYGQQDGLAIMISMAFSMAQLMMMADLMKQSMRV